MDIHCHASLYMNSNQKPRTRSQTGLSTPWKPNIVYITLHQETSISNSAQENTIFILLHHRSQATFLFVQVPDSSLHNNLSAALFGPVSDSVFCSLMRKLLLLMGYLKKKTFCHCIKPNHSNSSRRCMSLLWNANREMTHQDMVSQASRLAYGIIDVLQNDLQDLCRSPYPYIQCT